MWHVCEFQDNRADWHFPEEIDGLVKNVFSRYVYNDSRVFHVCELTPSYECWFIAHEAELVDTATEEQRDLVYDVLMEASRSGDVDYIHVPGFKPVHDRVLDCEPDGEDWTEKHENLVEHFQANTPGF